MKKLKTGLLAVLLVITAIMTMILAIMSTVNGSPWSVLYALVAVLAAIGARLLFWVAEYK